VCVWYKTRNADERGKECEAAKGTRRRARERMRDGGQRARTLTSSAHRGEPALARVIFRIFAPGATGGNGGDGAPDERGESESPRDRISDRSARSIHLDRSNPIDRSTAPIDRSTAPIDRTRSIDRSIARDAIFDVTRRRRTMMMLTTTPTTMRAAPTMRARASRARTAAVRPAVREVRRRRDSPRRRDGGRPPRKRRGLDEFSEIARIIPNHRRDE